MLQLSFQANTPRNWDHSSSIKVKSIKLMHHFFFDRDKPGIIHVKRSTQDAWEEQQILADGIDLTTLRRDWLSTDIQPLPRHNLSAERREQLIRIRYRYLIGRAARFKHDFLPVIHEHE
eukprot:m.6476 g.6476  ORF g.6476 m.6476 type:complete len:119 (+) comp4827_c0_seq1:1323-1679(+)